LRVDLAERDDRGIAGQCRAGCVTNADLARGVGDADLLALIGVRREGYGHESVSGDGAARARLGTPAAVEGRSPHHPPTDQWETVVRHGPTPRPCWRTSPWRRPR